jgi:hypothetical protein
MAWRLWESPALRMGTPLHTDADFETEETPGETSPAISRQHCSRFLRPQTQKPHLVGWGFCLLLGSLTITYFHTGIRTIIGVESFHGPVRDGKGWDRLAMVIRHDLLSCWVGFKPRANTTNLEEVVSGDAHQG